MSERRKNIWPSPGHDGAGDGDGSPAYRDGHGHGHRHGHWRDGGRSAAPAGPRTTAPPAACAPAGSSPPASAAAHPEQERYVTSTAIENIRKKVDTDLKQFFVNIKKYVDDTDIPFPGWGALGSLLIGFQYTNMQNDLRRLADNGRDSTEVIATALGTVERNWKKAEDAGVARYQ